MKKYLLTIGLPIFIILFILALIRYVLALMGRLDRLHRRVIATRNLLDSLTIRRASQAKLLTESSILARSELVNSEKLERLKAASLACITNEDKIFVQDHLDQGRDELRNAVFSARSIVERNQRETELSRALRAVLSLDVRSFLKSDQKSSDLLHALDISCYRVQLARSMHNLDVTQVRRLREHLLVRFLHLYGRAPAPSTIDFDDVTSLLENGE